LHNSFPILEQFGFVDLHCSFKQIVEIAHALFIMHPDLVLTQDFLNLLYLQTTGPEK